MTELVRIHTEVMNGQPEGKVGTNVEHWAGPTPATPPSPDENRIEVPRAPSCMKALHNLLNKFSGQYQCHSGNASVGTYTAKFRVIVFSLTPANVM